MRIVVFFFFFFFFFNKLPFFILTIIQKDKKLHVLLFENNMRRCIFMTNEILQIIGKGV